jgi:dipeptidyl aminopeptidase/acylaminoacyl peptidase
VVELSSPTTPSSLSVLDWTTGDLVFLEAEYGLPIPEASISVPTQLTWHACATGDDVVGWYYPPTPRCTEDPPPVIITCHGGPTAYSPAKFSLVTQYFTSRGIGILDVNYSGSSSMGRAYRERLRLTWGITDVRDCVDGARHISARGLADPARIAIMGSSAGGMTTLGALVTTDVFSAGISKYGVADLENLARDTSKFESHYTDSLVAPYPAERETYRLRSPLTHVDRLSSPLLLLQGALDAVVPLNQATGIYDAIRARGGDVELVVYEAEGHGFRLGTTIEDHWVRILSFLDRVWNLGGMTLTEERSTDSHAG